MRSTLIRCFTRMDPEGRVLLSNNVQKALCGKEKSAT